MALNKFYSFLRKEEKSEPILYAIDYYKNSQYKNIKGEIETGYKQETVDPIEAFIIHTVTDVLNNKEKYLLAENLQNDLIVERGEWVFSISNINNTKCAICNTKSTAIPENEYFNKMLEMIVATAIITNKPNFDSNGFLNPCDLGKIAGFIQQAIKTEKSEAFLDKNGNVNRLDLTTKLPKISNMIANNSLVIDENGKRCIKQSNAADFLNILVQENEFESKPVEFAEIESYNITPDRVFTIDEELILAENKENTKSFVLSDIAKNYLDDYYDLHKAGLAPYSVAFYGPSGAGKSVMAQVIARELNRPFVAYKMRENSDEDILRGTIKSVSGKNGQIEYEDSNIVKALKNGWVCEVQELSCCTNQGAETFFNNILDKTKTFEDAAGKTFTVHPDALIIFTYNPSYCENNQIATSLLNRIDDCYAIDFPDIETFVNIIKAETGYVNFDILKKIYNLCFGDGSESASIRKLLEENDIEEELSLRQVSAWIKRYVNCRRYNSQPSGWLDAAEHTIVQAIGQREPEIQADIRNLIETIM